jgi:hypothetical protein
VDSIDLQRQAQSFFYQVLSVFRQRYPDLLFTGLNCECDAESASLHVAVCDAFHDVRHEASEWPYTEIQQDVPSLQTPLWVGEYHQILALYFTGHDAEDSAQDALCTIIRAVRLALKNMREQNLLGQFGFAENAILTVWTEDMDVMARV